MVSVKAHEGGYCGVLVIEFVTYSMSSSGFPLKPKTRAIAQPTNVGDNFRGLDRGRSCR